MKNSRTHRGWLALGVLLTAAAHMRWGIGVLGWVAPAPFLVWAWSTSGWRSRAALLGALAVGWSLATAKIVTDPLPLLMAPLFGLPIALFQGAGLLAGAAVRRRADGALAFLATPAALTLAEWLQNLVTPLSTWGAAAYTQVDDLALLQGVSVFGMAGLGFLLYLVAALVAEWVVARDRPALRRPALAVAAAVVVAHGYGAVRLAVAGDAAEETTPVAMVGTDSTIRGLPLPTPAETAAVDAGLFARTRAAAAAGARLVVWTEAATLVLPEREEAWAAGVAALADELDVHLVAAYIVPLSLDPLRYENLYRWYGPDGALHHRYAKHRPVAGEPAVRGTAPPVVVETPIGRFAGAICYDYDDPRLALSNAALDVDIVALPSSDWRGIDPIHTQMAALRAIEGGTSIVRSTRWGLSAAIDPYGRARAWASHWEDGPDGSNGRVTVASLPRRGVWTPYRLFGDVFPVACGVLLLAGLGVGLRRRPSSNLGD